MLVRQTTDKNYSKRLNEKYERIFGLAQIHIGNLSSGRYSNIVISLCSYPVQKCIHTLYACTHKHVFYAKTFVTQSAK